MRDDTILCSCGCGTRIKKTDSKGRPRHSIKGHWTKTKKGQNFLQSARKKKGSKKLSAYRGDLTQAGLKKILHYDPETGLFTRLVARAGYAVGSISGYSATGGYIEISANGFHYKAHRLAWLYMEGYWPEHQIDHKNGIRDDNRWINLRHATQVCNMQNQKISRRNKSGFPGVRWRGKYVEKWESNITVGKKQIFLGMYDVPLEAALARYTAEVQCEKWTCNNRSELVKAIKKAWPEFTKNMEWQADIDKRVKKLETALQGEKWKNLNRK